ncbi:MAG: histidine phosphatase family protein [Terricaulis sp.]
MTSLFLVRHGEPESRWGDVDPDPGLSERGRAQAGAAAELLAAAGAAALISSPMRRCRETAAPLAEMFYRAPSIEPRVSEVVAPPDVDDRPAWLQRNFPWRTSPKQWNKLHAALHDWRRHVLEAVSNLADNTVVFSHFIAINVIVGTALGSEDTIVYRPDHASVTHLEVDHGRLRLVRLGVELEDSEVL